VSAPRDFWPSCGHHLLDRDASNKLLVTDEFLKAYLARPELVPPAGACAAERDLHRSLLRDPRQSVAASQIAVIADVDARENWQMMISWRDHLVKPQPGSRVSRDCQAEYQISLRPYWTIGARDSTKCPGRLRRCLRSPRCRDVLPPTEADDW
jgi:hypothetical protein